MKISIFKNIKTVTPFPKSVDVLKVLEDVRDGKYKNQVADIRIQSNKEKRNELKAKLHYVTFGGVFFSRGNNNLKQHSGLACLDFDDVNIDKLKEEVNNDKYTFSSFISPSGNGVKVLVKMPLVDNNQDYQDYYVEIQKHYDVYAKTDDAPKAIANACYLSYDDNIYINTESETFTDKYNRPLEVPKKIVNIPLSDSNEIAEKLEVWFKKRWSTSNRNTNLHAYARQMNAYGVDINTCERYLLIYEMSDFKAPEIINLIKSAYKYTSEFNTVHFEDIKEVRKIKNLVLSGKKEEEISDKLVHIDKDNLISEIKRHQNEVKEDEFWFFNDKGVMNLATFRYLKYLENNNIAKYYPNNEVGAFLFIKRDKDFIKHFPEEQIKDFTLYDLRNRGQIDAFEMMAEKTFSFNKNYLSMIRTDDINIQRDTKNESFIYYKNTAIKITKDNINKIPYNDLDGLVWENQVINRNVKIVDESEGEFKTFIWRLSGEDKKRYYTLKSVLGYLMHSYQNNSKPKAIIFNDEMISDDVPNGGSGKGLIHKSIGMIKKLVLINGKGFDINKPFAFQTVQTDTQVLLFDDIDKNFKFENAFSIITEGLTIEKKGQDAIKIPFNESPKISLTTNYTVKGDGASHRRRVFEVEIANHYNDTYTPEDEFGHQFFSDWDDNEWEKFDNFMIRCIQFYLNNGLVESNKVNLEFRKLKNNLGAEFIEFMESQSFDGSRILRKDFRDNFNRQYKHLSKFNSAVIFNKKVKDYCKFNNIKFEEVKSNGVIFFELGTEVKAPF